MASRFATAPPADPAKVIEPSQEMLSRAVEASRRAVSAGQLAPTFCLLDQHGARAALVELLETGPLLISFYRGIWCDFCDTALQELARIDQDIHAAGARHVAIGPPPANAAQRLRLAGFPMPVLADVGLRTAAAYGLTFALREDLREPYLAAGYTPPAMHAQEAKHAHEEWLVPTPATYVVGRTGRVLLATIDADYRKRMAPTEILAVLQGLRGA